MYVPEGVGPLKLASYCSLSGRGGGLFQTNKSGKLIRCMFMASVAVGKAFKTTEGILDSSQCPPPGYDSVVGEVSDTTFVLV